MRSPPANLLRPRARAALAAGVILVTWILSGAVRAGEPAGPSSPYVYQRTGQGAEGTFAVMLETAYGTRESRNFAPDGVELALRLRGQPLGWLGLEGFAGVLLDPGPGGGFDSYAAGLEVLGRALRQDRHEVNLDLGLGYLYDYRGDHIPRVRLTLGRAFGDLDLSLAGLLEIPVGSAGRDEADVMLAFAGSYAVTPWYRQGFELAGEDLEGLFEAEEAEGGAKVLFGPTAALDLAGGMLVRLNAAAVYAHTANQTPLPGRPLPDAWGFMLRVVLGWSLR
jgi:hypothetical protein